MHLRKRALKVLIGLGVIHGLSPQALAISEPNSTPVLSKATAALILKALEKNKLVHPSKDGSDAGLPEYLPLVNPDNKHEISAELLDGARPSALIPGLDPSMEAYAGMTVWEDYQDSSFIQWDDRDY